MNKSILPILGFMMGAEAFADNVMDEPKPIVNPDYTSPKPGKPGSRPENVREHHKAVRKKKMKRKKKRGY